MPTLSPHETTDQERMEAGQEQSLITVPESASRHLTYQVSQEWQQVHPRFFILFQTPPTIESSSSSSAVATSSPPASTDASQFSLDQLKQMQGSQGSQGRKKNKVFENLTFENVDVNTINTLFPPNPKYGELDPPKSRCSSAKGIREWRRMGKNQQQTILENNQTTPVLDGNNNSRQRLSRRRKIVDVDSQEDPSIGSAQGFKHAKHHEIASSSPEIVCPAAIPTSTATSSAITRQLPIPVCSGITLDYFVMEKSRFKDKDAIRDGYRHLVGKAYHCMGTAISNDLPMPLDPFKCAGFLQQGEKGQVNFILKTKETLPFGDGNDSPHGSSLVANFFSFHAAGCDDATTNCDGICKSCVAASPSLSRICKQEVEYRSNLNSNNKSKMMHIQSPTILKEEINKRQCQIRNEQQQIRYWQRIAKRQHVEDQPEMEISPSSILQQLDCEYLAEDNPLGRQERWQHQHSTERMERGDLLHRIKELDGTKHAHLYVSFVVCGICVGQILQSHTDMLLKCHINNEEQNNPTCFQLKNDETDAQQVLIISNDKTTSDRNKLMNEATNLFVKCGLIPKKHGELYPVSKGWGEDALCLVDRNAAPFFGVTSVGVHLDCYVQKPDGKIELWMAQRSENKLNYPSKWDPTVAGGLPAGVRLFDNLIKEAAEEAGISKEMVKLGAKSTGVLSQMTCCLDGSCLKQSLYFVWDMKVNENFIPKPADGEVDKFERWSKDTLEKEVRHGDRLRPAMRLVMTDFLI